MTPPAKSLPSLPGPTTSRCHRLGFLRRKDPPSLPSCFLPLFQKRPSQKVSFRHPRRLPPAILGKATHPAFLPSLSIHRTPVSPVTSIPCGKLSTIVVRTCSLLPVTSIPCQKLSLFPSFLSKVLAYLSNRAKNSPPALAVLFVARFFTLSYTPTKLFEVINLWFGFPSFPIMFNSTVNVIKDRDSLKYCWRNIKKIYHIYEQLRTHSSWGWDDERNLPVAPDEESMQEAIAEGSEITVNVAIAWGYEISWRHLEGQRAIMHEKIEGKINLSYRLYTTLLVMKKEK
ncbi:hypothetical protein Taro_011988 [Colocasia esculenta]|uniref:Uncharacterized protein n=1 Tax=Colocasia esculenta TaxID=4460 RepID=A0A843UCF9_COLES|nr:hypothetical protein [Colocasia esculenta]